MQKDMLDLNEIQIVNSPDARQMPITAEITRVVMTSNGFQFDTTIPPSWMTHVPGWGKDDPKGDPNDPGDLLYTVWMAVHVVGIWQMAGFIQKFDFTPTGAPILSVDAQKQINNFQANWAYDGRWGMMNIYTPREGDMIGLMLTAGNGRGTDGKGLKMERTQMVLVQIPPNGIGDFRFSIDAEPGPVPVDVPPSPEPTWTESILAALAVLDSKWTSILNTTIDHNVAMGNQLTSLQATMNDINTRIREVRDAQDRALASSGAIRIVLHPVDPKRE